MTDTTPLQSFGSTEAGNAIIANEFSGPAHFNFHGGPGEVQGPRVEKEACLRSLAFGKIHSRRHDIDPAHPGTCDWLFRTHEFQQWRDPASRHAHHGVLWIRGKPGAGKSTLMKHAFSRYQQDFFRDHLIVAYFFNARGETLEKTPLGLLRSIVYQLLENDDELYERFAPSFREKQRSAREANWEWLLPELKEFVRLVAKQSRPRPLLLIVDALDECDESDVREVVGFLESLSIHAIQDKVLLHICLSSRHYPSIRMAKFLELTVERSTYHQRDITKYLKDTLRVHDSEIEAEIQRKADGIFLWVVIVVSLLNKAYDEGRVEAMRKTLEQIPSGLERIFSAILDNVDDAAETVVMFQWVLLSQRPLSPRELFAAVVRVGLSSIPSIELIQRRITTSSKGLIEVRKGEWESIQFIHLSVSDFLFRQKRLQTLDPTLGLKPVTASHGRLWARCWSCIKQADTTVTSSENIFEVRRKDPLLEYAARHILDHAERALSRDVIRQDGDGKRGRGKDLPESLDTSQRVHVSIKQWLRQPERWFRWCQEFIIATSPAHEKYQLMDEMDAGLLYSLALRGLPNLLTAVSEGADINAQGGRFGNALQVASYMKNQEIVQLLLEKGADVNAQGGSFGTALQAASRRESEEIVQLLLDKGADVNTQGGSFGNALQAASRQGSQEIVQLLLDNGADVNAQGGSFGNALQAASWQGSQEIVQLLLKKGANINVQGGKYGNALQAALASGSQETVQLLPENGANVEAQPYRAFVSCREPHPGLPSID